MPEGKDANFANAPSSTDRLGAVVCHAGIFLGLSIIVPLILVLAVDKEKKPFVHQHAKQALVFQIILLLITICLFIFFGESILAVAGFATSTTEDVDAALSLSALLFFLIGAIFALTSLIFICIASYKAATGQSYKYPFLGRF